MVSNTNSNQWFADFETLTLDSKDFKKHNHTDVYLWHIKNKENTIEKTGCKLKDFIEYVINIDGSPTIFFHNLSFDGNFIIKYLKRNYTFLNSLFGKAKYPFFTIHETHPKIYNITFRYSKDKIITFMCSYNILNSSIDALGKTIDTPKFDYDGVYAVLKKLKLINTYDKNKIAQTFYDLGGFKMPKQFEPLVNTYIKSDVEIARQSYINFENDLKTIPYFNYLNKDLSEFRTASSLSFQMLKASIDMQKEKQILPEDLDITIDGETYDYLDNYKFGGFTSFNPSYRKAHFQKAKVRCYDINSSYPFQMLNNLPYGEMLDTKPDGDYIEFVEVEISSAEIKPQYKDIHCLRCWKSYALSGLRYVPRLKNFTAYYYKPEFDLICEFYFIKIKSIKHKYFKALPFCKEYIEYLYKFKEHYSNIGNTASKNTFKILMNAGYGKLSQRKVFNHILYLNPKEKQEVQARPELLKFKKGKKTIYYEEAFTTKAKLLDLEGIAIRPVQTSSHRYTNIAIGIVITALGRIQLLTAIKTIIDNNIGVPLYWDTDSIFYKVGQNNFEDYIPVHNSKLGAWSLEGEFDNFIYAAAKRYYFFGDQAEKYYKFGFAGIDKKRFDHRNVEAYYQDDAIIPDAKTWLHEDDYGYYLDTKDIKLKWGNT